VHLHLVCNSQVGAGAKAVLPKLGVASMSAVPIGAGEAGMDNKPIEIAAGLLRQAIEVLDRSNAPPELGARVQTALDALDEHRSAEL
jgi:hypothetical protein